MNNKKILLALAMLSVFCTPIGLQAQNSATAETYNNSRIDGYRGIWFSLGLSEYGYKYSGGLGSYTAKHNPLAIYAEEVDKTFFVFGGTPSEKERRLLCMVGVYDHKTGMVSKPTVVFDKVTVNDPHDNPALLVDGKGYIWVYVSGRGNSRPGHRFRSTEPYNIEKFELMNSDIMAYPQPKYVQGEGHFLFFTRYDGMRQLFFQTSPDGKSWSEHKQLVSIKEPGDTQSGHYSTTAVNGKTLAIAFNRHPNGACDYRTNLYYLQTNDFGKTWTTADRTEIKIPVKQRVNPAMILDTEIHGDNLYVKDINFDSENHPVILYVISSGWEAGAVTGERKWYVASWNGKEWFHHYIASSDHCYDTGSIWLDGNTWTVIAPTDPGPQHWGTGGEIVSWISNNKGETWSRKFTYTKSSAYNHGYVRRPLNAKDPFFCFWTDGNADAFSVSRIYFGDSKGKTYLLPYNMTGDWEKPILVGSEKKIDCDPDLVIKAFENDMVSVNLENKKMLVSKYEVTQVLWYAVMENNPSFFQKEDLPVQNVSYNDVMLFLKKLNVLTGKNYRLPSFKEWRSAAEGDNKLSNGKKQTFDWNLNNSGKMPNPVGHFTANRNGLHDMLGNVWEWTNTPVCEDADAHRLCGGSWNNSNNKIGMYYRKADNYRAYNIGFRVVLDVN